MKTLHLEAAYTLLRLTNHQRSAQPLMEQAGPYLAHSPNLIVDLAGIRLSSMLIGELLNLHRAFVEQWAHHEHRIALVNLTPASREALDRVRLTDHLTPCASIEEAVNGANGRSRPGARA